MPLTDATTSTVARALAAMDVLQAAMMQGVVDEGKLQEVVAKLS